MKLELVPSEPDEARRWALLDAPKWTSAEALQLILTQNPILGVVHHCKSVDVDDGFVQHVYITNLEIAIDYLLPDDADALIDRWDVTEYDTPYYVTEDIIPHMSTPGLVRFVERYPKSTWWTGQPPKLRNNVAGPCRSLFVAKCIGTLWRRLGNIGIDKYNDRQYAEPIRIAACQCTRGGLYVSYTGKTKMHV